MRGLRKLAAATTLTALLWTASPAPAQEVNHEIFNGIRTLEESVKRGEERVLLFDMETGEHEDMTKRRNPDSSWLDLEAAAEIFRRPEKRSIMICHSHPEERRQGRVYDASRRSPPPLPGQEYRTGQHRRASGFSPGLPDRLEELREYDEIVSGMMPSEKDVTAAVNTLALFYLFHHDDGDLTFCVVGPSRTAVPNVTVFTLDGESDRHLRAAAKAEIQSRPASEAGLGEYALSVNGIAEEYQERYREKYENACGDSGLLDTLKKPLTAFGRLKDALLETPVRMYSAWTDATRRQYTQFKR